LRTSQQENAPQPNKRGVFEVATCNFSENRCRDQQGCPFESRHLPLPGWLRGSDTCACAIEPTTIEPTARKAATRTVKRSIGNLPKSSNAKAARLKIYQNQPAGGV
jgi:hypothetical protein